MEKKIAYIGNAKNNTTLKAHPVIKPLRHNSLPHNYNRQYKPKLITGSALIPKYLLSEKENKKA